ncbi:MAG TPA: fructosamine kinase family protein, partial [Burkholderiales bacterium]|nr:fructosamine kinase family protein [Burkholderiales bacterium]
MFRKEGAPSRADAFAAEADGLEALRPHIRVPQVLDRRIHNGKAFIVLEHLDLKRGGDFAQLGAMLAALHRQTGPRFGWARDNYIGLTPQQNGWRDDWVEFWREHRMRPQVALAKQN